MVLTPILCGKKTVFMPKECEPTSCEDSRVCYGTVDCMIVGCDSADSNQG